MEVDHASWSDVAEPDCVATGILVSVAVPHGSVLTFWDDIAFRRRLVAAPFFIVPFEANAVVQLVSVAVCQDRRVSDLDFYEFAFYMSAAGYGLVLSSVGVNRKRWRYVVRVIYNLQSKLRHRRPSLGDYIVDCEQA